MAVHVPSLLFACHRIGEAGRHRRPGWLSACKRATSSSPAAGGSHDMTAHQYLPFSTSLRGTHTSTGLRSRSRPSYSLILLTCGLRELLRLRLIASPPTVAATRPVLASSFGTSRSRWAERGDQADPAFSGP
jgi:hypothetical protein